MQHPVQTSQIWGGGVRGGAFACLDWHARNSCSAIQKNSTLQFSVNEPTDLLHAHAVRHPGGTLNPISPRRPCTFECFLSERVQILLTVYFYGGLESQGACPLPLPLGAAKAGRNHLNKKNTPPPLGQASNIAKPFQQHVQQRPGADANSS